MQPGPAKPSLGWHRLDPLEILEKTLKKRYLDAKWGLGLDQGYPGRFEAGPRELRQLPKMQNNGKKNVARQATKKRKKNVTGKKLKKNVAKNVRGVSFFLE